MSSITSISRLRISTRARPTALITRCSTHDQSTKSCNLRLHQRSSKGLRSLYGFGEWPSQGLNREVREGWVGKHVRSPLSISAPAAAAAAGTRCTARASCLPKWATKPVVGCWPARRRLPTGQPSAKPRSAPGSVLLVSISAGGWLWPAAAEGRLHEGCSVVRDVRWVRGARLGTSPA